MKFKKGLSKSRQTHKKDDKVVISSEYYTNEIKPSYLCSFCNQTLVRLTDAGQNNTSFWCRHCSIEFEPESENLRSESKLVVPDRNIEPAVTSIQTNMADEVEIRHSPPLRGGFAELQKKGLKIKNYHTTEKE
jgi:DNA-directed RNA polymerase subunit RPC12/RpoP